MNMRSQSAEYRRALVLLLPRLRDRSSATVTRLPATTAGAAALDHDAALPPLLAPKAVAGEYAGCFLAAMLLAAEGLAFGPTAGFREADPELGVIPYDGRALPRPRRELRELPRRFPGEVANLRWMQKPRAPARGFCF